MKKLFFIGIMIFGISCLELFLYAPVTTHKDVTVKVKDTSSMNQNKENVSPSKGYLDGKSGEHLTTIPTVKVNVFNPKAEAAHNVAAKEAGLSMEVKTDAKAIPSDHSLDLKEFLKQENTNNSAANSLEVVLSQGEISPAQGRMSKNSYTAYTPHNFLRDAIRLKNATLGKVVNKSTLGSIPVGIRRKSEGEIRNETTAQGRTSKNDYTAYTVYDGLKDAVSLKDAALGKKSRYQADVIPSSKADVNAIVAQRQQEINAKNQQNLQLIQQ